MFGAFFDKEIKGVIDGHIGDQIDLDLQFGHRFRKDKARQPVAIGVLLQVHEMLGGRHFQRMRQHLGPAVRCRAKANDLRAKNHRTIIFVMRQMIDACLDRHVVPLVPRSLLRNSLTARVKRGILPI